MAGYIILHFIIKQNNVFSVPTSDSKGKKLKNIIAGTITWILIYTYSSIKRNPQHAIKKLRTCTSLSVFYFWKNAKNDGKREGEGMILSNNFSFAFHSFFISPAAPLYLCSVFRLLHWVFPRKVKLGSLPFVFIHE